MVEEEIMKELINTLDVTRRRVNQRINAVREEHGHLISREEAAYLLASEEGIDVAKHVENGTLQELRGLQLQQPVQQTKPPESTTNTKTVKKMRVAGIDLKDPLIPGKMIREMKQMSEVYQMFYALENSVRDLILRVMENEYGKEWWDDNVSNKVQEKVKSRMEQEARKPWYGKRGGHEIFYTNFGDLANIIRANWEQFEDIVGTQHFLKSRVEELEDLRNVIAHNNPLNKRERQRIKLNYEDWIKMLKEKSDLIPDSA